jgi:hypothetical protein
MIEQDGIGETEGSVGYAEIEMDAATLGDLGVQYRVNSIPTLLAFSRGEPQNETKVARLEDLKSKSFLEAWIREEAKRGGKGGAGGKLFGLFGS